MLLEEEADAWRALRHEGQPPQTVGIGGAGKPNLPWYACHPPVCVNCYLTSPEPVGGGVMNHKQSNTELEFKRSILKHVNKLE